MVTLDRFHDDGRNGGRRSRGASPNDLDGIDDERSSGGMRVGHDYQAGIPLFVQEEALKLDQIKHDAMLVWSPPDASIADARVEEYLTIAKEKHGYNTEQALGMLFWHKHNIEKSLSDLANYTPFPDEWTVEDKVLFEEGFSFHGKTFHRIRQMLPDKSIASLVKYYYSWKKTRSRTSLMDRHARRTKDNGSESEGPDGSSDSDVDNSKENGKDQRGRKGCANCGAGTSQLHSTPKGSLCNTCYQYWRRTGVMRSTVTKRSDARHHPFKNKRRPPRGMHLQREDLLLLASGPSGQGDAILKNLETDLVELKRQVQNNKQMLGQQKHKTVISGVDKYRQPQSNTRINARWSNEELLLAVQGVRRYGKNFHAIAELIGNKTSVHVASFFNAYKQRYNLEAVLNEYLAECEAQQQEVEDEDVIIIEDREEQMDTNPVKESDDIKLEAVIPAPPPLLKNGNPPTTGNTKLRLLPGPKANLQQPPPLVQPTQP